MAEWLKAAVLKTVDGQPSGGSNPSLSASFFKVLGIDLLGLPDDQGGFCKHFANMSQERGSSRCAAAMRFQYSAVDMEGEGEVDVKHFARSKILIIRLESCFCRHRVLAMRR